MDFFVTMNLNLKGGGGGGLECFFNKESKSEKKNGRGGGRDGEAGLE